MGLVNSPGVKKRKSEVKKEINKKGRDERVVVVEGGDVWPPAWLQTE